MMYDEASIRDTFDALRERVGARGAYLRMASKVHQDKCNDPSLFQYLDRIYKPFRDEEERARELEGQATESRMTDDMIAALDDESRRARESMEQRRGTGERRKRPRVSPGTTPNAAALTVLEGIVSGIKNGTLTIPKTGCALSTILSTRVRPIRMLLGNELLLAPGTTDFWTILETVSKQDSTLGSAVGFFYDLRTLNPHLDSRSDVPCDASATSETIIPPDEDFSTPPSTEEGGAPLPSAPTALDIFNSTVREVRAGVRELPMNGSKRYSETTFIRNVAPIRRLLENTFPDFPVEANETDLVGILESVVARAGTPQSDDSQWNKLPTAARWFLRVLQSDPSGNAPTAVPFFNALWDRILPELMADKTSVRDYISAAKRCTNGSESLFPRVQTVEELVDACSKLREEKLDAIIASPSQRNRVRVVIAALNAVVDRVGYASACDYLRNASRTASVA